MRFPIDGAFRIGYGFGYRGDIGVPGASKNHEGIDIVRPHSGLPVGTPVHAILPGKVIFAGNSGGGAGYTTLTEHKHEGDRYRVRSNHFSSWLVKAGRDIREAQVLGLSGGRPGAPGAGSSGGEHYHLGLYKLVSGRWKPIDPGPFFGLGSTRGIGSTRPGVTFPAFAGGDAKPLVPDRPAPTQDREEEDEMSRYNPYAGIATQRGTDGVWFYLIHSLADGRGVEFNSGSNKPVNGADINALAIAYDTPPWAKVTESLYNAVKRSLAKVEQIQVDINDDADVAAVLQG